MDRTEKLDEKFQETLQGALDGDHVAQQIVFSRYFDLIASVAWRLWPDNLRHVVTQEDLTQDIIARMLQKFHTVDRTRLSEFSGWIKRVATSEVLDRVDYWRAFGQRRIHARVGLDSELPDVLERFCIANSLPESLARRAEARMALNAAIAKLPADQREAIHCKYFLQQDHSEIAVAMKRSVGAVRELLRRGEARLEAEMGSSSHWLSSR